jgi:hypothetical protein
MRPAVLFLCLLALLVVFAGCSKSTESDNDTVKKPRFLPESGTYEAGQYMSIQCGTEDAEIRYTVDLTEPTLSSPLYTQSLVMPDFFINNSNYVTIKAKAFRSDLLPSPTATATYSINYENTAATPAFDTPDGTFNYSPMSVYISCSTPGAQIRYTLDGSEPNYASTLCNTGYVMVSSNNNIRARAFKAGWNCSPVAVTHYVQQIYETAQFPMSSPALDVAIDGNYAYVAENGGNLRIYDISNPRAPEETAVLYLEPFVKAVAVQGNYAYVATSSTLYKIDVSNHSAPVVMCYEGSMSAASEVVVRNNYAYVTDISDGFSIFDISNSLDIVRIGYLNTPGWSYGLCLNGDYAYVADGYSGISIINISNPAHPAFVTTRDTPGMAVDVTISGNNVFVSDFSSGMSIYTFMSPTSLDYRGTFASPDFTLGIQVVGNLAFCAEGAVGVRVIDISDLNNPQSLGYCRTEAATDLEVNGNYIYLADDMGGFRIIYSELE